MIYLGYDPGGNQKHGVAAMLVEDGRPTRVESAMVETAELAIRWLSSREGRPAAIGVDTLTCWSTGPSGWRPADRWLKERYPNAQGSVASPNSLYGSMSINGMAAVISLKATMSELVITETHPKVLHWHLRHTGYDFACDKDGMLEALASLLGFTYLCDSDHEWDAVLSALAAFYGSSGQWELDLHQLPAMSCERLIRPCGETRYFWPGQLDDGGARQSLRAMPWQARPSPQTQVP